MASELIQLRARAKKAGIPASEFKGLGIADLKNLIAGSATPAAAKKGAPAKGAAKPAVVKGAARKAAPAKGAPARKPAARKPAATKPTAKKAPATSTARKPATRSTAAKGTAKRPSSAAVKKAPVRKPVAAKAPARKPAKATAAGRNLIDNSQIDWQAEWSGGQSGNRQTIIKAVRRFKGDTTKVFNHLADQAQAMFPKNEITNAKRTKAEAQAQLRWMISRVKLDFVKATGQHESSTNRAGYGESDNEQAIARRKATLKQRKALGIKAPARGRVPNEQLPGYKAPKAAPAAKKAPVKAKAAPKRTTPQKPAQRRTAPATRKAATTRKPAARKPVARGRK